MTDNHFPSSSFSDDDDDIADKPLLADDWRLITDDFCNIHQPSSD